MTKSYQSVMDAKTKTIMVVEDEKPLVKAMAQELAGAGYTVLQANDGREALDIGFEAKPDLILLDIKMPRMDGIKFMQELRGSGDSWATQVKVIILTNFNADDQIIAGLKGTEPAYYLVKAESTIVDIQNKVREVLGS